MFGPEGRITQGLLLIGVRPNQYKSADFQKVLIDEKEMALYKEEWLDVVDTFYANL